MSTVMSLLDTTAVARPVLETALRVAEVFGADVEAVHVSNGSTVNPEWLAQKSGVPLRVLTGPVEPTLPEAVGESEIVAGVLGARATMGGRQPVGRTTRHVLERATKSVVIVPPETTSPRSIRTLLVPLEGTHPSSRAVLERLWPLLASTVELVVLHVFTESTLPRMLDRPDCDTEMFGVEFLARHLPQGARIEVRIGPVGRRIAELTGNEGIGVDLVVLSWSQDTSAGRAQVIQEVLGASEPFSSYR